LSKSNPKETGNSDERKIGRRQLIQVLGAAAGSALVGAVMPEPAAANAVPAIRPAAPVKSTHGRFQAIAFNHISYNVSVSDYAKERDFWIKVMGMEDVWDDGNQCALQSGNAPNQIYIRPVDPAYERRLGFAPPRGAWADQMGRGFVDHYCFSIANYDGEEVREELTRRGLNPKADGPAAWSFKDPSGWTMHISDIRGLYPGMILPGWKYENGIKNLSSVPKPTDSPRRPLQQCGARLQPGRSES